MKSKLPIFPSGVQFEVLTPLVPLRLTRHSQNIELLLDSKFSWLKENIPVVDSIEYYVAYPYFFALPTSSHYTTLY